MNAEPKLCKQCGVGQCAEFWLICAKCVERNKRYGAAIITYCRNFQARGGYHRRRDWGFTSKEHKHRKTRSRDEYARDEKPLECEENVRTDYHGDNYVDE